MTQVVRAPLARRQRERLARRREILDAATHVFAERGYPRATLEEIAATAEFAKGTIYNYFRSKEEIFRQIVTDLLDDVLHIADTAAKESSSAREAFLRYATDTFDYFRANEDVLGIVSRELFRLELEDTKRRMAEIHRRAEQIAAPLACILQKEMRGKRFAGQPVDEIAELFVSIVHHRCAKRLFHKKSIRELNSHEEAKTITLLFFDGVLHQ